MNKLKSWYVAIPSWVITLVFLSIITVLAAFLRFYEIGKLSLWGDEIDTMGFVDHNLQTMFKAIWPQDMSMTLYYVILNFWVHLFSNPSEGTLRVISAVFSVASIPIVFLLGRTISTNKKIANTVGLLAALLVSLNAYHIQYAQELRSYSLTFLLATLSTLLLIKAIEKPNSLRLWMWYVLASVAGIYSHYFIGFLILAQMLSLFILYVGNTHRPPFKKIIVSYIVMVALIIPLIIATLQAGTGVLSWVTKPTSTDILQFMVAITGNQGIPLLVLYATALLAGFFVGRSWEEGLIKKWIPVLFINCLFLPACIVLLESEIHTPLFVERYFLFSLSFLSILAAFGITKLIYKENFILKLSGIFLFTLLIVFSIFGVQNYFTQFQKDDWRDTSKLLTTNCAAPEDLRLYYPTWIKTFTSYYNNQIGTQNEVLENSLDTTNAGNLTTLVVGKGYKEICLVHIQDDIPQNVAQLAIIQTVLGKEYPKVTTTQFPGVAVDIYQSL